MAKSLIKCGVCGKSFSHKESLMRHKRSVHTGTKWHCATCDVVFSRKDNFQRHKRNHDKQTVQKGGGVTTTSTETNEKTDPCNFKALNGTVETHTIDAKGLNKFDPMSFLKSQYDDVKNVIKRKIKERGRLKWYLSMKVKMSRRKVDNIETAEPHFRGKCQTSLKWEDIDEGLKESIKKMYTSFIEYQRQGSNWTVDKVVDLTIHMARYRPLKGSSYIPLPIKLRSKHAIVNVKNKDSKCFMWSILAAMYPAKRDGERVWKYKEHTSGLNFENILFPVKLTDIPKFEMQNEISINVFGFNKGDIFPIHISKHQYAQHVNLLMISDNKKSHYCWIKDLNRLLGDQHTHHGRHFYCPYCLHGFTKERILSNHLPYCQTHGPQKIELPTEDNKWLHYKDIRKQLKVPYIIYADFECLQEPIVDSNECDQKTKKTTKHVPCGFAYKVVGLTPETSNEPVVYRGADAADKFVECMNLGQYHDLYVLSDVLALADVFENFREICLNYYGLDAAHFYTSPGLAWQAALKMTGVKLELLTDIDMHLFIEKGLRGGISMMSHRHAKANHKHVPNYDPNQPINHVMYLDANNLYGWAMSQALPVEGFRWLNDSEIENLNISDVVDNSKHGFILEVDLEYPRELHDDHNEYPLAPEKLKVTNDMLSPYAEKLLDDLNLKGTSTEKLIPNLHPKQKYVVHYRNLKLYLSLGMKLTKIHRVMTFEQRLWLKTYIDFNTEKRKLATNEFEKDFFKLMNNAVFGKTMENLRKRTDIKLLNDQSKDRKLISKPTLHAFKIFNDDLVAVHMLKQRLYLNRPIYVGFTILDLSKTLMYDFHYNYIKDKYGSRATLLFTDTDSLCYNINTNDIYQDMMEDNHLFDTSEYDPNHPLHSTLNKKVLGKMKDETHGIPIQEFVCLKSKMYSLIYEENKQLCEKKTAKGIKKSVIKHDTRHQHYKQCLFNKEIHMSTMTQIRSYDHKLYNISINKLGLSPYDDKRYLLDDGIQSLAYGHWRI
ncbi:uncharacterized protein [Mytilus edulis]|uniref:uncharacterized protein n=1 Tax=Mytilus edulis TaxID=6550 RepID=UPI0039EF9794